MSTFPKYERYKESGVEWLGEIPGHWKSEKGKWLFVKMDRPVRPEDDVVTAFRDGQVTLRTNRRTEGFTNAIKEHGYQGIRKGDLVIHAMDAFAGAIGVSESDGKSTPVYSACVPRKPNTVSPELYAYLLRYMAHSGFITTLAKGIRERSTDFRYNDFGSLGLPFPPKPEQDCIVAFLDLKTAEIDALIAKKQRQIELLDEQKAILINRAVTRGLNPDAKFKPSGIEWIGDIPEHWEVKPIKRVKAAKPNAFVDGPFGSNLKSEHFNLNGEVFVIDSGFATRGKLNQDNAKTTSLKHFMTISRSEAEAGDLVIAKIGAWYGLCSILPELAKRAVVSGNSLKLSVDTNNNDRRFIKEQICYIRRSGGTGILVNSSAQPALSLGGMASLQLACPPPAEQFEIADEIDRIKLRISKVTTAVKKQIESIKTLRSTLIAHAVTGKIKI